MIRSGLPLRRGCLTSFFQLFFRESRAARRAESTFMGICRRPCDYSGQGERGAVRKRAEEQVHPSASVLLSLSTNTPPSPFYHLFMDEVKRPICSEALSI